MSCPWPSRLACAAVLCLLVWPARALALPSKHPFEIVPGSFSFSSTGDDAGAHDDWITRFDFAHVESGPQAGEVYNDDRTNIVNLPAGFDASSTAVPTCTLAQLFSVYETPAKNRNLPACPIGSQVGLISFEVINVHPGLAPAQLTVPLYNMQVTSYGTAAELGFKSVILTQVLDVSVRPGDEGLTITSSDVPTLEARNIRAVVWGVPAAHEHDAQRGETCGIGNEVPAVCKNEYGGPQEAGIPVKPFLSNPTSCGTFTATLRADSWEHPEEWLEASNETTPVVECERVAFQPSIDVQPSTRAVESSTGLDVSLVVPQTWENPFTISTSNLKDARVTLPEGVTVNPSAGSGLGACTLAQYAAETASSSLGAGCPPESKIGSIEIETPLLEEKIPGAIYIAKPYENPFGEPGHPGGSLLALYVVAKDPARGIIVKVAGKVQLDPVTGRLTTTFLNNPQQPFSRFTLRFRPGATAPLVSPPVCGTYTTQAQLTPWSAPSEPRLATSSFLTTEGLGGASCPMGGVPPFHPRVISGTQNNSGGSYSPFYLRLVREDGEQELTRFSTILPPGLTGNLSGIPFCPDSAIEAAKSVTGAQEEVEPSCPRASEVGHAIVSAGVGAVLAQTPGEVYLAGPYHGAPLSLVSITSAKVGPFDLGTVVIRFALNINPTTAQVEVSANGSDPIPHIIDGIVVHVRDIRVYVDRPDFILNPTDCSPLQISETITGAGANPADPAGQTPVSAIAPFQAADCASLTFKPSFTVSTSGRTSKAGGASLDVKLTMPGPLGAQANIHQVKVELPVQLPSRLTTLQKACTKAQFDTNPAGCPAASVVGHARAITPILPVPLEGPAYFVSNGAEAFPNLILVLQGYGITIDLVGDTFISKAGITSSTFKTVPDQPVTSFELTLPQGPFSALTANANLCALTKTVTVKKKVTLRTKNGRKRTRTRKVKQTVPASLSMPTEFVAQNGMVLRQTTPIAVTGCPKAVPTKAKRKAKARKKGKKG